MSYRFHNFYVPNLLLQLVLYNFLITINVRLPISAAVNGVSIIIIHLRPTINCRAPPER